MVSAIDNCLLQAVKLLKNPFHLPGKQKFTSETEFFHGQPWLRLIPIIVHYRLYNEKGELVERTTLLEIRNLRFNARNPERIIAGNTEWQSEIPSSQTRLYQISL